MVKALPEQMLASNNQDHLQLFLYRTDQCFLDPNNFVWLAALGITIICLLYKFCQIQSLKILDLGFASTSCYSRLVPWPLYFMWKQKVSYFIEFGDSPCKKTY